MRILPQDEHQVRKERILQAVVHIYIRTGKPVGSSTIGESYALNLSPATIRNVLADLEKEGYLTHPHTSAGRIPTDQGYQFYVDSIAQIQRLAKEEENRIRNQYTRRMREIEDLMRSTTRVLSALSHCTGFVISPSVSKEKLSRIELIPVNSRQVLGVLVSENGLVRNQMIKVDKTPSEEVLRSVSRELNQKLSGTDFDQAQQQFQHELDRVQSEEILHKEFLNTLSEQLFDVKKNSDIYFEGASNILNFPEFQDHQSMQSFAQLIDEKKALGKLLNRELNDIGLKVKIGFKGSPALKDFSVVSTRYEVNGRPMGVLGILGPKRMEYERMMSIVDTVAHFVNELLMNPSALESMKEKK